MKKKDEIIDTILLVFDNQTIDEYAEWYFSKHPKASKKPIKHPYHESINEWMIMKRPQMNCLKQRWKDFICWLVHKQGYDNLRIDECEIFQTIYYPTNRRKDLDNSVPKFVLDGLVVSGMIIDDSYKHITKLTMSCDVDPDNPRTELLIKITKYSNEI